MQLSIHMAFHMHHHYFQNIFVSPTKNFELGKQ